MDHIWVSPGGKSTLFESPSSRPVSSFFEIDKLDFSVALVINDMTSSARPSMVELPEATKLAFGCSSNEGQGVT